MSSETHKRQCTGVWLPVEVLDDESLIPTDKILLVEIDSLRGENNEGCFASNEYLGRHVNLSPRGVETAIRRLKDKGLIYQVKFDGRRRWLKVVWPNVMHMLPDGDSSLRLEAGAEPAQERAIYRSDKEKEEANASLSAKEEFLDLWNTIAPSPCALLVGRRVTAYKTRMSQPYFRDNWRAAIERMRGSDFLQGKNNRGWKATIDWFLKPDSVAKIMEGKYDNRTNTNKKTTLTDEDYAKDDRD